MPIQDKIVSFFRILQFCNCAFINERILEYLGASGTISHRVPFYTSYRYMKANFAYLKSFL